MHGITTSRARLCGVAVGLLGSIAVAWGQAAPDGVHQQGVGAGGGLSAPTSPTGGYAASIPLALPPPRGHLPVPVSILYTGSTRAGAAGAGWDVPIGYVRRSVTSDHRFPGNADPGTRTAAERIYVSVGGAPQLMVPGHGGAYVPFAGSEYSELRPTATGWSLRTLDNVEYLFEPVGTIEDGVGWYDPDLWILKEIRDRVGTDKVVLHYDASKIGPCDRELNLDRVEYAWDAAGQTPLYTIELAYEPFFASGPWGNGSQVCASRVSPAGVPERSIEFDMVHDGGLVFSRSHVLRRVEVHARNNLAPTLDAKITRSYDLGYSPDSDSGKPRLVTVTTSGEEGTSTMLPVATYAYGALTQPNAPPGAPPSVTFGPREIVPTSYGYGPTYADEMSSSEVTTQQYSSGDLTGELETTKARHVIRDFTGDGVPDLLFKSGSHWYLYKNRTTATVPDLTSSVITWDLPAELDVSTTFRIVNPLIRRERQWMVTTQTWTQFLDWNGDGRLDVVDANGSDDDHWTVWINKDPGNGTITWTPVSIDVGPVRSYLTSRGFSWLTFSTFWLGGQHPNTLPLERTRSWPRNEDRATQHWNCHPTSDSPYLSCEDAGIDHQSALIRYDTMTEWQLADQNGDSYPDFVTATRPVRECEHDVLLGGTTPTCPYAPLEGPQGSYSCTSDHREWISPSEGDPHLAYAPECGPPYAADSDGADVVGGMATFLNRHGAYTGVAGSPFAGPPLDATSTWNAPHGVGMWTTANDSLQDAQPGAQLPDRAGFGWAPEALSDPFGTGLLGLSSHWSVNDTSAPAIPQFQSDRNDRCTAGAPASTPFSSDQLAGPADLDGDGLTDAVYSEVNNNTREWFVRFNTGTGYGPPRAILSADLAFALSASQGTCGGSMQGKAGLVDLDGDGKPELVRVENGIMYMSRLLPGSGGTTLAAGRLISIYNGYGATTNLEYANAKIDGYSHHDLPFPEIVVSKVWTSIADGSAPDSAPVYFAYGRASLSFDPLSGRYTFPGYGRALTLAGLPDDRGRINGVLTVSDRSGDAAPGSTYQDHVAAHQITRTFQAEGPYHLENLASYLQFDAAPFTETTVTLDAVQTMPPGANPGTLDCADLDPATGLPAGGAVCGTAGVVFARSTQTWEGDQAPPDLHNTIAGSSIDAVDQFGRPLQMKRAGDLRRTDDDVCTTLTYAAAPGGSAFPSVPSSMVVTDCGIGEVGPNSPGGPRTLSAVHFLYDTLPEGQAIVGRLMSRVVDRYDETGYRDSHVVDQLTYDTLGEVETVQSPRALGSPAVRTTNITRDAFGMSVRSVHESSSDVAVSMSEYTDASTWPSVGVHHVDAHGVESGATFDPFGRLTLEWLLAASGKTALHHVEYDDSNAGRRVIDDAFPDGVPVADVGSPVGRQRAITYLDAVGRARFTQRELGADRGDQTMVTGLVQYDALGRPAFVADPFPTDAIPFVVDPTGYGYGTTTVFDRRGRPTRVIKTTGYDETPATTSVPDDVFVTLYGYTYGNGQSVISHVGPDENGGTPAHAMLADISTRTALGREIRRERTDVMGQHLDLVDQVWDRLGRVTETRRYQDPANASNAVVWRSHYDSLDRRLSLEEPGNSKRASTYDEEGNELETSWDDHGIERITRGTYDGFGRPTTTTRLTRTAAGVETIESTDRYHYDAASGSDDQPASDVVGRLSWAETDGVAAEYYAYDDLGRVASTTYRYDAQPEHERVMTMASYSVGGRLQTLYMKTDHTYDELSYVYDSAGDLSRVDMGGDTLLAATLRPDGRPQTVSYGNGAVESFEYAPGGAQQLDQWSVQSASDQFLESYLGRDGAGRVTSEEHITTSSWAGFNNTFDGLGRLQTSTQLLGVAPGVEEYTHDPLGNLLTRTATTGAGDRIYQPDTTDPDRLCRFTSNGLPGPCDFTYDGAGNVVVDDSAGLADRRTFTYDSANRLLGVNRGHASAAFLYGPSGRISSDIRGSSGDRMVWDFGGLVRIETRADGVRQVERRIPGPFGVFASLRTEVIDGRAGDTATVYIHGDNRANRVFTDENGEVAQSTTYGPYGRITSNDTTRPIRESHDLWNGGDDLPDLGLTLLGPRAYDPDLGRFLQRDPISITTRSSTANPYAFSFSDPVDYSDPSGLTPFYAGGVRATVGVGGWSATAGAVLAGALSWEVGAHYIGSQVSSNPFVGALGSSLHQIADPIGMAVAGDVAGVQAYNAAHGGSGCDWFCTITSPRKALALWWEYKKDYFDETINAVADVGHATADGLECVGKGGLWCVGERVWSSLDTVSKATRTVGALAHAAEADPLAVIKHLFCQGDCVRAYARTEINVEEGLILGRYLPEIEIPKATPRLCFAAGTLVRTDHGLVPIEEIRVGDRVWSRDEHTGTEQYQRVLKTFVTPTQHVLRLEFRSERGSRERIVVTPQHPFWVNDTGWIAAGELRPGMRVFALDSAMTLISSSRESRPATVYNFEVERYHTYFAGWAGFLVHNSCIDIARAISESLPTANCRLECMSHAKLLKEALQRAGVSGVEVVVDVGDKYIYSNKFSIIGEKGSDHVGIRVGDMVFDNMNPSGISFDDWLEDLGGAAFLTPPVARVTQTPF